MSLLRTAVEKGARVQSPSYKTDRPAQSIPGTKRISMYIPAACLLPKA